MPTNWLPERSITDGLATNPEMNTTAVIPIKQLNDAKKRLADYLAPEQRKALCQVMFEDVLEAVIALTTSWWSPTISQLLRLQVLTLRG